MGVTTELINRKNRQGACILTGTAGLYRNVQKLTKDGMRVVYNGGAACRKEWRVVKRHNKQLSKDFANKQPRNNPGLSLHLFFQAFTDSRMRCKVESLNNKRHSNIALTSKHL